MTAVPRVALALVLAGSGAHGIAAERPVLADRSEIAFSIKQMGVPVTGVFRAFSARVALDPEAPEAARARVDVSVASLDTGVAEADETALSRPWLHVRKHPEATFTADGLRAVGGDRWEAAGMLTLRGRRRPVTVPLRLEPGPGGITTVHGTLTISRTAFGIGGGEWDAGDLVADEVTIRVRLVLGPPESRRPTERDTTRSAR